MTETKAKTQIAALIRNIRGDAGKPVPLDLEEMLTEEPGNFFGARFSRWCGSLSCEESTTVMCAVRDYLRYLRNRAEDLKDEAEALEKQGRDMFPELRDSDFKHDFEHCEEEDEEGDEEEEALFDEWLNSRKEGSRGEERNQGV